MKKIALVLLSLTSVGCASFQDWQSGTNETRKFQTERVWVRETMIKETLKFRKMNRFTPILVSKNSNTGVEKDLLIAANAMDSISAYEPDSGKLVWRIPIQNGVETAGAVFRSRLFFGANDGNFYAVNVNTGSVDWTYPVRQEILSEPLTAESSVYFLSGANSVYSLSQDTGKAEWIYNRQDPSSLSIRGGSKPAIKGNSLFVGFSDGTLVALQNNNGAVKWEKKLNRNKKFRDIDSTPLVDDEFLYVLGYDDAAYSLRAATGEIVWKTNFGGYGEIIKVGDRLGFASTSEEFVAVDSQSGKKIWSIATPNGISTGASLLKGLMVFGDSLGQLRFVEPSTGRVIGSFSPGSGIHATPRTDEARGTVYFISNEANLYALKVGWRRASEIPFLR